MQWNTKDKFYSIGHKQDERSYSDITVKNAVNASAQQECENKRYL